MPLLHRLSVTTKALTELGPEALLLYARYQLGLRSGALRRQTPPFHNLPEPVAIHPLPFLTVPDRATLAQVIGAGASNLQETAAEISRGRAPLFGDELHPLELAPGGATTHWTAYALGQAHTPAEDIKLVWEGGRFGWALTLARAYQLTGDPAYADTFWTLTERFLEANPPYFGPHWESAQEAALRMISLLFAFQAFKDAPETTEARASAIANAVAAHAKRIPPTLGYARAQNNNHLLSEAVGLLTAGAALPDYPEAISWRDLGWRWFNHGLQNQIAADGSYVQQSATYHRLMLQISIWGTAAAECQGLALEPKTRDRLAAATRWALALLDPHSGRLPNLGPNDGSQLLPLASTAFADHRPTLAAAARAFLDEEPFPPGPWDELGLWLGLAPGAAGQETIAHRDRQPAAILRDPSSDSWGYLRIQNFSARPGHADLLHLDLWRGGVNLAQDAGTYLYNADPPWDNALAPTAAHNTVTVDGQDQMTRAGRFLWLDWPETIELERRLGPNGELLGITAQHDGYQRQGALHVRAVDLRSGGGWVVEDQLVPPEGQHNLTQKSVRLHWLLGDWLWTLKEDGPAFHLGLESPQGLVRLTLEAPGGKSKIQLVRAGELLQGRGPADPTHGWTSLTYASKQPALSVALLVEGKLPMRLISTWSFEEN